MFEPGYRGILCIGDPHLCTWAPGYRKDDYARAVLGKLRWALQYARDHALLPILLGDVFHVPRDNNNWLIIQLMELLRGEIFTIVGNHDLSENLLCEHDSLQVLIAAGRLQRLSEKPWVGSINGVVVAIGGSDNGQPLPTHIDRAAIGHPSWAFWFTHHEIAFPGQTKFANTSLAEIPGIDLVVNGHLHRQFPDVVRGSTTWCNPGNIARVSRSDATREHVPGVLRIDVALQGWTKTRVDAPHASFEQAFHAVSEMEPAEAGYSSFITSLQSMQKFKTADGEGLRRLVVTNLPRLSSERVKNEILNLLREVLPHARVEETVADDRAIAQAVR